MRPNWFVAFPVVAPQLQLLPPPPRGIRRLGSEDLHLTVAFLGACGVDEAQRAFDAACKVTQEVGGKALEVNLSAVVPMGSLRRYSALSALLGAGREAVADQISILRKVAADAASVKPDQRKPKPHITLARPSRRAEPVERERGLEWVATLDVAGVALRLDRLALYTWSTERPKRLFRIVSDVGAAGRLPRTGRARPRRRLD